MQVLTTAPRLPHRYVKTKTFDMMERRQTLRKTYYQGFAGIDFFISVIWHAFLLWWTIQVRRDYHRDCTPRLRGRPSLSQIIQVHRD